jgi:hypothetical protein
MTISGVGTADFVHSASASPLTKNDYRRQTGASASSAHGDPVCVRSK